MGFTRLDSNRMPRQRDFPGGVESMLDKIIGLLLLVLVIILLRY
jgi:hypothetical protein